MIKTIYICEKCGHEQLTDQQFWKVGVQAHPINYPHTANSFVTGKTMEVCRPCLESFGIHVQQKQDGPAQPVPTVEDLIKEIIERCSPE